MARESQRMSTTWKPAHPRCPECCDPTLGRQAMGWLMRVFANVQLPENDPERRHEIRWRGAMAQAIARGHAKAEELPLTSAEDATRLAPPPRARGSNRVDFRALAAGESREDGW